MSLFNAGVNQQGESTCMCIHANIFTKVEDKLLKLSKVKVKTGGKLQFLV